ncbi:MAG: DUF4301 family protein [Paludibacteraceae bacterium]|nr:DUF4301 family protein [Paludibacteraceae bacterium]
MGAFDELTQKDLEQIEARGISQSKIRTQLENFEKGFPFANIYNAATVGNGIVKPTEFEINNCISDFERLKDRYKILKFVPSSGAASRMFKELVKFSLGNGDDLDKYPDIKKCLQNIDKFAFYEKLKSKLRKNGLSMESLIAGGDYKTIAEYILSEKGLNYQKKPKAMLEFHKYENDSRTPFEEHLVEGARYATDSNGVVHLHYTISTEHREMFNKKIMEVVPKYEAEYGVKYDITLSEQKPKTDMLAINMADGKLVRNADGSLLFRPGGHGALIENLNDCTEDIIFIKNIDNVTVDRLKDDTYTYKKFLAGLLMILIEQTNKALEDLDSLSINNARLAQIEAYASSLLQIKVNLSYFALSTREKVAFWHQKLNRPIRVCGMVRNEGEPGGGPYWVKDKHGETSLQIIESSQIDFNNKFQVELVQKSSHFNPVDLVCSVKNYKGNKFNLKNYIDPLTGFISSKSQNGIDMKIQELPGLWNGSMANWITVFVEVPPSTFTPVKTLVDLLRPEHQ